LHIENNTAFNVILPQDALQKHILCYNIVFPERNMFDESYTLMPNACGTLSLGFDGTAVLAELWGASITPTLLGAEPNKFSVLLLVQLSPYGLYQLTRQSQTEFADKRMSLEDIDYELFCSLQHAFLTSRTVAELACVCDKILHRRLERPVVSDTLILATEAIANSHGQIRVKEIACQVGYSERHLNRLFLMQVGMNIKHYTRLVRFNYVLKHVQKSPCFFAPLSQQAGYFDQAHFDKDFKAISGVTPQDYLKKMSHFYYDAAEVFTTLYQKEE
jgi:AraC-like DNA-binding protein